MATAFLYQDGKRVKKGRRRQGRGVDEIVDTETRSFNN